MRFSTRVNYANTQEEKRKSLPNMYLEGFLRGEGKKSVKFGKKQKPDWRKRLACEVSLTKI